MFTQNELLLMIGVVGVLLVSIIILTIIDIREYLKSKKTDTIIENEVVDEVVTKPSSVPEPVDMLEPIEVLEVKDEEVLISDVDKKEEAPIATFVTPNANVVEPSTFDMIDNASELNVSLDEEKDLYERLEEAANPLPSLENTITNFELEQERTAIISLDELLKKSDELYSENEVMQYDDGNEPITIDEVINRYNEAQVVKETIPEVVASVMEPEKKEAYTHKEAMPFISSLYGLEQQDNALEFENTATYEKLDKQSNNEFMRKLREVSENKQ